MPTAQKVITGLVILLFLCLLSILLVYWLIFRGGSVGFLSLNPKLKWGVDRKSRVELEAIIKEHGDRKLIVFFLSPSFEYIPSFAVGLGVESRPIFFGRWSKTGPIDYLNVFVDYTEWEKEPIAKTGALASRFILRAASDFYQFSDELEQKAIGLIFETGEALPVFGIVKR